MIGYSHPSFILNNKNYSFTPAPGFPDIPYAEVGRRAKVYRLQSGRDFFALKVFKHIFRNEASIANCAAINAYQDLPGLKAAQRTVIHPHEYPDLIQHYPDFAFAVLMPWMKGQSWYNTISQKTVVSPENSLSLARSLAEVLAGLEERQIAHCDLSASNFIYSDDHQHVELVDLEEMFAKGLLTPDPLPAGTSGYAPQWIMDNGCWSAGCDRFSTGILLSEILGWRDERVRDIAFGDTFFDGLDEFGHKTERHALMLKVLGEIHPRLVELFDQVWFANCIEECPRIEEWRNVFQEFNNKFDGPYAPKMKISPQIMNFGSVKQAEITSADLIISNIGGGILEGSIKSLENWVGISPGLFKIAKGKESKHQVSFKIEAKGWSSLTRDKIYSRNDFLLVETNIGITAIKGMFVLLKNSGRLIAIFSLISLFLICLFFNLFDFSNRQNLKNDSEKIITATFTPQPVQRTISHTPTTAIISPVIKDMSTYTAYISNITISIDGSLIALGTYEGNILILDAKSLEIIKDYSGSSQITCLDFSKDGQYLAAGLENNTIQVWYLDDNRLLYTLRGHEDIVGNLDFSPDSKELASSSADNTVRIWQMSNGKQIHLFFGMGKIHKYLTDVEYSPDGQYIIAGTGDGNIRIWNERGVVIEDLIQENISTIYDLTFFNSGRYIASADDVGQGVYIPYIHIWDVERGIITDSIHIKNIPWWVSFTSIALSNDDRLFATGFSDGTAKIWKFDDDEPLKTFDIKENLNWGDEDLNDKLTGSNSNNLVFYFNQDNDLIIVGSYYHILYKWVWGK
ncbi:MAG: hypothetical protein JXB49_05040 [Bacteroidales bacterium]|nr:hypothetical protein [Bacteroidales bacterium]